MNRRAKRKLILLQQHILLLIFLSKNTLILRLDTVLRENSHF